MTSKNLFFNLLKEDFRRRLWTFILSSLVFFGTFGIVFTMVIQNWVTQFSRDYYGDAGITLAEKVSRDLCNDFYGFYPWFILVAVVGAVICGMSGFSYLHSRKQMDFYHSLPVKREMIFTVRFVNGILIYAVPYLVGLLYSYLLCVLYGVMTSELFFCGLFFFVLHLMGYIVLYLVTILSMMLTGKMVIAFFGNCVLNFYAPAIYALVLVLKEAFFITTYDSSDMEAGFLLTKWISPTSYYYSLIYSLEYGEGKFWLEFLGFLLLAVVLVVLVLWLYKKRASEKADISMCFKVTEPVIRIMLSIPIGTVVGMLFYAIQYENNGSMFWLIFGGLLGGFLAHAIIETLYKGDIKKCLSHKVQMFASMVIAAAVPLMFVYDVFGYDSYLPEKEEIASMAVASRDLRFGGTYYDEDGWVNAGEYALDHMEVTNVDAMYELAEILTEYAAESRSERFFGYYDTWELNEGEKVHISSFIIRYRLKNGSEVTRTYRYNYYEVMDLLEQMYNDEAFKTVVHPVFPLLQSGWKTESVEVYAPASGTSVRIQKNHEKILQMYAEELLRLDFARLKDTAAIGELTVQFITNEEKDYRDNTTFLLYPEMTGTIALLKEQGYHALGVQDSPNVTKIAVSYDGNIYELKKELGITTSDEMDYTIDGVDSSDEVDYYIVTTGEGVAGGYYEERIHAAVEDVYYTEDYYYTQTAAEPWKYENIFVEFTDPAEIEEIKKNLIESSYTSEFGPFPTGVGYMDVNVYFEVGNGEALNDGTIGWNVRYCFAEGSVPTFVMERLFKEWENNK